MFNSEKDRLMDEKLLHDYHDETAKKKHKKNITGLFLITLVLSVIFSVINWGIISDWGNVKVTRLFLTGTNGDTISAMMYTPRSATEETPAPLLFNCHGNAGNARNHESWAVEFARRGFVVVSIDHLGAGDSENTIVGNESYGDNVLPYMMNIAEDFYAYASNLNFVDKDNIIIAGHSMGCGTASSLAARYNAKAAMLASGDIGAFIAVKVGLNDLPEGSEVYVEGLNNYNGSILLDYGDVEQTPESICEKLQTYIDSHPAYNGAKYTEPGQIVGSFEEGNALVALLDHERPHEAAFVNAETIEHLLWFGQNVVGEENVPHYIEGSNQIWQAKDYVGLVGMLIYGLFIISVALMLIEYIPFFEDVKRPLPRNIGLRKIGMWISIALGFIFPYLALRLGSTGGLGLTSLFGLINPSRNSRTVPGFRLMFANVSFGFVIALNLLGILGLLLYYFTEGRKVKVTASDFGLTPEGSNKLSAKMIFKSLLVAALTVGIGWTGIKFGEEVFGTDLYAWFFGFKAIPVYKIDNYVWYIIIWIACFIIGCFTLNVERRLPTTGKVWLDDILQVVFNVFMATFVLVLAIIVCWRLDSTRGSSWFFTFGSDIKRLWGMPAGMAIGVGGSTLLFRKTGNAWLCAFLMGTVAALIACTFGQVRIF